MTDGELTASAPAIPPTPMPDSPNEAVPGQLHKTLTVSRGVGVSISMIVGSGLLVLPGLAYAKVGSAAVFAWVGAAAVVLPLLLIFAQLGSRYPNAGGVIGFVQAAFGRRGAAPIAFILLGACAFGGAVMAITGGNYMASLLGTTSAGFPAAAGFLLVVGVLNALGSRLAGGVQTAVTALLVLLIALVAAVPYLTPGFQPHGGVDAPADWSSLLPAIGLVFFAFTGWELVASTTEEYHNPRRDLPLAVGVSFVVIVLLYVGVANAVQVSLPLDDPQLQQAPVAAVLRQTLGGTAGAAAAVLGTLIIFATLMGGTWATSRIAFATAREGLLPRRLTTLTERTGTPTAAIVLSVLLFGTVVLANGVGWIPLDVAFRLSAVNFVVGYTMSVLAYGVLFRRWWQRLLALVALVPVVVVLIGFGWLLLYPAALLVLGAVAHRWTARRAPIVAAKPE